MRANPRESKYKRHNLTIGLFTLFLYILFSYIATDNLISTKYNSYALYLFLGYGIVSTLYNISRSSGKLPINMYTAWYISFFFLCIVMMTYSPEFRLLSGTSYLMIVSLILTYFASITIYSDSSFKAVCWFYSVSAISIIFILFITGNLTATSSNRLGTEVYGNANTFAEMIMISVLLELWLVICGVKSIKVRTVLIVMIIIETYSLFLSGGRKFIIIPLCFMYILLCLKSDSKGRHQIIKYTIFVAAIVIIMWQLITKIQVFYDIIGYRMIYLINGFTGKGIVGTSADIRARMRETAIDGWLHSPLWGHGFDSYKFYGEQAVGKFAYSHCNYTEMLYNGGIISFIAYYLVYFYAFKTVKESSLSIPQEYRSFCIAMLLSLLVYDYGCVTYASAEIQMMIMLAFKALTIKKQQ